MTSVGLSDETNMSLPAKVKRAEMKIKIQQIKGNESLAHRPDGYHRPFAIIDSKSLVEAQVIS